MDGQYTTISNEYSEMINENISFFPADDNNNITTVVQGLVSIPHISSRQYAVNITYIVVAFFGVFGNTMSLVIVCIHPPIRKRLPNYYFINQTIADLLVSLMLVPSVTTGLIPYGYSNPVLCLVWQCRAIFVGLYDVSVYSIVALSVERYLEVVYPIWHKKNVTKMKVIVTLIVVWVVCLAFKYAYIVPVTRVVNGVCNIAIYYPNKAAMTASGLVYFCVDYLVPLILILFFYIQMWRGLRNKVVVHPGPTAVTAQMYGKPASKSSSSRARRNIIVTLVIIVVCFIACNTHKQVLIMLKTLSIQTLDLASVNFNISQILSFLNATIEPYIYLIYHREFQIGFRKLFRREKLGDSYSSRTHGSIVT